MASGGGTLDALPPGLADILVVDGNLLDDLAALRKVRLIMQAGRRKGGA